VNQARRRELLLLNDCWGPHNFPDGEKPITTAELRELLMSGYDDQMQGLERRHYEAMSKSGSLEKLRQMVNDPACEFIVHEPAGAELVAAIKEAMTDQPNRSTLPAPPAPDVAPCPCGGKLGLETVPRLSIVCLDCNMRWTAPAEDGRELFAAWNRFRAGEAAADYFDDQLRRAEEKSGNLSRRLQSAFDLLDLAGDDLDIDRELRLKIRQWLMENQ
jgi:hypothetical protein